MIILTHRLLGNFLCDYLNEYTPYGNRLNRQAFVYGNVKPDIETKYRTMSHYYCHNQDFVYQLFEDLCTNTYPRIVFSDKLGVLIHFLTDYTCVFHSSTTLKSKEIQKHMKYETQLHFKCVKFLKSTSQLKPIKFSSLEDVKHYIQDFIFKIDSGTDHLNVERDIYYMTLLTVSVTLYIMQQQSALKYY